MTDRAALRVQLNRKTQRQLTNSTDQDYYLNLAENDVLADWSQFDPSYNASLTIAVNPLGYILLPADFVHLVRVEDSNRLAYAPFSSSQYLSGTTGYRFIGIDQATGQRKLEVRYGGQVLISGSMIVYIASIPRMGTLATDAPALPEEFRELISTKAAQKYWLDQGPPFAGYKDTWAAEYDRSIKAAQDQYESITDDAQYVESNEPDSGYGGRRLVTV